MIFHLKFTRNESIVFALTLVIHFAFSTGWLSNFPFEQFYFPKSEGFQWVIKGALLLTVSIKLGRFCVQSALQSLCDATVKILWWLPVQSRSCLKYSNHWREELSNCIYKTFFQSGYSLVVSKCNIDGIFIENSLDCKHSSTFYFSLCTLVRLLNLDLHETLTSLNKYSSLNRIVRAVLEWKTLENG